MIHQTHLATAIISDKRSTCVFQVIKEVADTLGITLEHATRKYAQTLRMLEWADASLEKALKIYTGKRKRHGTRMPKMPSSNTTRRTTRALGANLINCSTAVSCKMSSTWEWACGRVFCENVNHSKDIDLRRQFGRAQKINFKNVLHKTSRKKSRIFLVYV